MVPANEKMSMVQRAFKERLPNFVSATGNAKTADRMVRIAIAAIGQNTYLMKCTPVSLARAAFRGAQLGLEPGSPLGEAYLVPYGDECQLVIGYRGLITLARRSGMVESIEAIAVHARDRFEFNYGLDASLTHKPWMPPVPENYNDAAEFKAWMENSNPGPMIAVYALAHLKGGVKQYVVMTRAEVEKIRAGSKQSDRGPWKDHFDEMAKKTAIRRLVKYLPMSIELANAVSHDDAQETGEVFNVFGDDDDAAPDGGGGQQKPASATDKLKGSLAASASAPE
jgi:recombination protein RecT